MSFFPHRVTDINFAHDAVTGEVLLRCHCSVRGERTISLSVREWVALPAEEMLNLIRAAYRKPDCYKPIRHLPLDTFS